jgi:hypothetical protein
MGYNTGNRGLQYAAEFLLGAWRLFGQGIWHIDAWRDR